MTQTIDETKLEQLMGQMVGHMTGAALCFGVWLGDELGLYRALTELGDRHRRRARGRGRLQPPARARVVGRPGRRRARSPGTATTDRYGITPEATMALADDESPVFVARAMNAIGSVFIDMPKVTDAFRGDGGLSWGDHHQCLFSGTEWFFRTGYRAELPNWIAALDGVADTLASGGTVADVGCGHGASAVVLAQQFPAAQITGFDFHQPSIDTARDRADEAGVGDRVDLRPRRREELLRHLRPDLLLRLPARHGRPGRHRAVRP